MKNWTIATAAAAAAAPARVIGTAPAIATATTALLFLLAGCRGSEHAREEEAHGGTPAPAEAHADSGGAAGTLHIDPEMLRDLRVTTTQAQARAGGEGVTVLGELRVDEEHYAEIGSPIPGHVTRLLAAPGDRVRAGQPLVELQSVELGKARAEYLGARARAELAHQALERKEGLAAEQIAPLRELQEARAETAAADASLRAARAGLGALGVAEEDIDADRDPAARFVLRSPMAGTVLERNAVRGQMSDPTQAIFRVGDLSHLWLVAHAFERDAIRVARGAPTRIEFPALPGRIFAGNVERIGGEVDVHSRTIPIRIGVANADGLLRPGMSATAWVPLGEPGAGSVVAVPAASLQRLAEGWCVFVPHAEGVFEIRPVGRGRDLGSEVEILHGLQPGDTIVVDGAFLLKAEADKARGETAEHED